MLYASLVTLAFGCASGEPGFADGDAAPPSGSSDDAGEVPTASATTGAPEAPPEAPPEGDDASPPLDPTDGDDPGSGDATVIVSPPAPPFDAGEGGVCSKSPGPGDLAIVEILIESVSGTGDHGEWLEVQSRLDCVVDLVGLSGQCPLGAKVSTFEVVDDLWIPPRGTFVVADSSDPRINHGLTLPIIPWNGEPGDVLRNNGSTVTLLVNGTIVDSVTYPAMKLHIGASLSFPSDCPPGVRSDWTEWKTSSSSWFPAFFGTPNAPNDDVHCSDGGDL
jgi:hypothetical protein